MKTEMELNNDADKDIQKLFNAQKKSLYWLLGIIYISFFGVQLGRIQAIADFNYSLHEMLFIPESASTFLIPIAFLVYIYFVVKYLQKKAVWKPSIKTSAKIVLVLISLIMIFSIRNYQTHEISTGGIFEVTQKMQDDNHYFLVIDEKKISVSRNEYNLVDVNKKYMVNFVWHSQSPDKGSLETIEPIQN